MAYQARIFPCYILLVLTSILHFKLKMHSVKLWNLNINNICNNGLKDNNWPNSLWSFHGTLSKYLLSILHFKSKTLSVKVWNLDISNICNKAWNIIIGPLGSDHSMIHSLSIYSLFCILSWKYFLQRCEI